VAYYSLSEKIGKGKRIPEESEEVKEEYW